MIRAVEDRLPGSMGRACIYSRVSNPTDTRERSLDDQEEYTASVLRRMGYVVEKDAIFRERGSGKDYSGRPVLNHVRDRLALGEYKAIGFFALDRLSRSQAHVAILFDEFERFGVLPVSATEDISGDSPEATLIRNIRAYVAEVERLKINDRMNRAKTRIRDQGGLLMNSGPLFGYRWDKKNRRRLVDEDEARVVLDIFLWCSQGFSTHEIVLRLRANAVKTSSARRKYKRGGNNPSGTTWCTAAINDIIRNPQYVGISIQNRFKVVKNEKTGKRKRIVRDESEWDVLDDTGELTPAIVPETLWRSANDSLDSRRQNRGVKLSQQPLPPFLLRKMIHCAVCGRTMYGIQAAKPRKDAWYICSSHTWAVRRRCETVTKCSCRYVQATAADKAVWEALKRIILTPGHLEGAIERLSDTGELKRVESELESARKLFDEKTALRSKLYEKWRKELEDDGDPDFAQKLEADYRQLRPLVEQLRNSVKEMEARRSAILDSPKAAEGFRAKFEYLRDKLIDGDETTPDQRYEALVLAKTRVLANGDDLEVEFEVFDDGGTTLAVSPPGDDDSGRGNETNDASEPTGTSRSSWRSPRSFAAGSNPIPGRRAGRRE